MNRVILNQIQPKVDPYLRPNQNGFRPGRSTTAHILGLRRLIEGVKERNLKAALAFIHFKKAFPAGIYLLKVNNRNTRTSCEICSKLTIKTPERCLASFWCLYC